MKKLHCILLEEKEVLSQKTMAEADMVLQFTAEKMVRILKNRYRLKILEFDKLEEKIDGLQQENVVLNIKIKELRKILERTLVILCTVVRVCGVNPENWPIYKHVMDTLNNG